MRSNHSSWAFRYCNFLRICKDRFVHACEGMCMESLHLRRCRVSYPYSFKERQSTCNTMSCPVVPACENGSLMLLLFITCRRPVCSVGTESCSCLDFKLNHEAAMQSICVYTVGSGGKAYNLLGITAMLPCCMINPETTLRNFHAKRPNRY